MSADVVARHGISCYNAIKQSQVKRPGSVFMWPALRRPHPVGAHHNAIEKEVSMKRYQVWLDGKSLNDIDPAVRVIDIREHAPASRLEALPRAMGDGMHVTRHSRDALSVTVSFVIREYQPTLRKTIMQKIRAWAQGHVLQISDRPGQRLTVKADQLPSLGSALKWTDTCSVTFTARDMPYWEEAFPTENAASSLTVPGDAPFCPLDLRWTCRHSGAVTLVIETPLSRIVFIELQVSPGQELVISHPQGIFAAALNSQDILPCRTPASSDDLLVPCGCESTVSVYVDDQAAQGVILSARGRWL